jgi:RTX calcium-binding nonapeptide repeat (4 copies)
MSAAASYRGRIVLGLFAVAALLAVAPTAIGATTVRYFEAPPDTDPSGFWVRGGPADNDIRVEWRPDSRTLIITDTHRIRSRACEQTGRSRVRCRPPEPEPVVYLEGRFGDDRMALKPGPRTVHALFNEVFGFGRDTLLGGSGADSMQDSDDNDVVRGRGGSDGLYNDPGPGSDVLSGGAGEDTIFGGPGADTLRGGPGNDQIDAADGDPSRTDRDRLIDCGEGLFDEADWDRVEDPMPVRCEQPLSL